MPNQRLKVFCGTPSYMAPEITRKSDYEGNPVDIWACGVLLYVMLVGAFPFRGTSEQDLYQRIQRGHFHMHEALNNGAGKLIKGMLEVDPRKRVQAHQLIREPYVICDEVRMTAFEMAGSICRQNNQRNFRRDDIKLAHNRAVELLVSPIRLTGFRKRKTTSRVKLNSASKRACSQTRRPARLTRSTTCTRRQLFKIC